MNQHYANAERLLPPELLNQLQQHVGIRGRMLWIPGKGTTTRQKRDAHMLILRDRGYPAVDIADRQFVSVRTVRRVFARHREGRLDPQVLQLYRALSAPSDTSSPDEQSNPDEHTRR